MTDLTYLLSENTNFNSSTMWGPESILGDLQMNSSWGQGVNIYYLDTGTTFAVKSATSFVSPYKNTADDLEHGDDMIDLAVNEVYGLAQSAKINSIKLAHDILEFRVSDLMKAFKKVFDDTTNAPTIINLSGILKRKNRRYRTHIRRFLNCATQLLAKKKILLVRSAGNFRHQVGKRSPQFLVGGYMGDDVWSKSSYGKDLDLFAPALSPLGGEGTSLSAAYVSAAMAAMISFHPELQKDPLLTYDYVRKMASKDYLDPKSRQVRQSVNRALRMQNLTDKLPNLSDFKINERICETIGAHFESTIEDQWGKLIFNAKNAEAQGVYGVFQKVSNPTSRKRFGNRN